MPGFDFSNYNRNAALHARGVPLPKATSTGTTIVGCIYDNGVVVRPHHWVTDNFKLLTLTWVDCRRYQSNKRSHRR